jgi:CRP-like cAMP-binding protein
MTFAAMRVWKMYDRVILKAPFLLMSLFIIGRSLGAETSFAYNPAIEQMTVICFLSSVILFHYNAYAEQQKAPVKVFYLLALSSAVWMSACGLSSGDRALDVLVGIAAAGGALSLMVNFAGSVLSFSYLLLMCAALAFGIGNVLGADNLWWRFAELFAVVAVYVHALELKKLEQRRLMYEPRPGSDSARLVRSFSVLVSGLLDHVQNLRGDYCAALVQKGLAALCAPKAVRLTHHRGTVQVQLSRVEAIGPISDNCLEVTEFLIRKLGMMCGDRRSRGILYGILESMYWEDKEIVTEYVTRRLTDRNGVPYERRRAVETPVSLFQRVEIFKDLPERELRALVARFRVERYPDNYTIIRQGDRGDKFYIVASGEVIVAREDGVRGEQPQATLRCGDYFGEIALLKDIPRTATVRSATPVKLLSLAKEDFDRLVRRYFAFHAHLHAEVKNRTELIALVAKMPIFAEFSHQQIAMLALRIRETVCPAGTTVVQQGERGDRFYIVKDGEVAVSVAQGDGTAKEISTLHRGEYFGEIALILAVPRTATVTATKETVLLCLDKKDFDEMIKKHLLANRNLEEVATRRMYNVRKMNT